MPPQQPLLWFAGHTTFWVQRNSLERKNACNSKFVVTRRISNVKKSNGPKESARKLCDWPRRRTTRQGAKHPVNFARNHQPANLPWSSYNWPIR
jgi:hypothetical protein